MLKADGFSVDWSNINNLLGRKGIRPGSANLVVDYEASYQPNAGGWSLTDPGDTLGTASNVYATYDSARRRHVLHTDAMVNNVVQTWELDARLGIWYVRSLTVAPGSGFRAAMSYDSGRRVAILFGGTLNNAPGGTTHDVWEYKVSNLANGEGCTAASAATCASGNCVDGVCCESAGCTGLLAGVAILIRRRGGNSRQG